jgi:hypothetical protein
MVLAQREGGDADWHAARLRAIFDGHTTPSPDELTTIDLILARPRQSVPPATEGEWLL